MTPQPTLAMSSSGLSDVGRQRSRNEDSFAVHDAAGLAVVCDGMGGHAGGDIASRTAAAALVSVIVDADSTMPPPPVQTAAPDDADRTLSGPLPSDPTVQAAIALVRHAVQEANGRVFALNRERGYSEGRGMGTTVVGFWRVEGSNRLVVFHAGDSRLYRLRDRVLLPLTRDHSLYQVWLDNGSNGPPPQKNIIVRALGTAELAEPDLAVHTVFEDDIYLLCTDGLTGLLDDREIEGVLVEAGKGPLEHAARRLVDLANDHGGNDNVTVVVARFGPPA